MTQYSDTQQQGRSPLELESARLREKIAKLEGELERLRDQYVRYYDLVELAVDAILMGDERGVIIGANRSAEELTGYSRQELIGMKIEALFSEAEQHQSPLRYDLLKQGRSIQNERLLTRRDGSTVAVEMNSRMMPDATYHTFIRDITRRLEMEEEIQETEMKQKALADAAFEAIFLASKGICLGQNKKAEKMFGYSGDEAVGRAMSEWIAPEKRDEAVERAIEGAEYPYETVGLRKDGTTFPAEVQSRNILFRGETIRVTALRDITERQQAEHNARTIQKLEGLGTLAGGIAHDFNNLLTGIFGSISLARLHLDEDHPVYAFLDQAEGSLNRATHLTQKLLTFAKGGEPVRQQVDLAELVAETVSFDLSGSNVKLLFERQKDLWQAEVDKGQIQQVFSNLAINADQAMPSGGHLFVSLENYRGGGGPPPAPPEGRYIKVTVQDDGEGIREEHLGRIFDPYFSTKQTGRGLGLATVFSIISKHNGSINVSSRLGVGTTFTLYLPAQTAGEKHREGRGGGRERPLDLGARVLVMDDDVTIRKVLEKMLALMHCTVTAVENGGDAVRAFSEARERQEPYDLVILDLTIPGGRGGRETVDELLRVDPAARVVVSSGYAEDPVLAHYRDYGFAGVVAKPYIFRRLQQELSRVLGKAEEG